MTKINYVMIEINNVMTKIKGALIGFIVHYKMSQEAAAKKFF